MTELTRSFTDDTDTRIARWVVSGPGGAIELASALGSFAGLFRHSRTDRYNEGSGDDCKILGGKCWSDALGQDNGRDIFKLWTVSDDAVYDRLEQEYRREWPGGGNCGESVPQANYDDVAPNAGSAE